MSYYYKFKGNGGVGIWVVLADDFCLHPGLLSLRAGRPDAS